LDLAVAQIRAFMASTTSELAMRRTTETATALDAFIARKAEIDTMLDRLKALSDEHFGYSPDDINWGHVGTRRRLQGGRIRAIAGCAPTSPRSVIAGGAWGGTGPRWSRPDYRRSRHHA
jgi:hypothetical protein